MPSFTASVSLLPSEKNYYRHRRDPSKVGGGLQKAPFSFQRRYFLQKRCLKVIEIPLRIQVFLMGVLAVYDHQLLLAV